MSNKPQESIGELYLTNLTVGRLVEYLQLLDPSLALTVMTHSSIHITYDNVMNFCDLSYEGEESEDDPGVIKREV